MANPTAVPGSLVPSGSLLTPTGGQGYLGPRGTTGPTAISTDAGNTATLGSDSRVFVPAFTTLASASVNGLLKAVSGSTRDLVDGTNNCAEAEVRATWTKRYYWCWHFDHPLDGNFVTSVGTGSTVAPFTPTDAGHAGQIRLNQVAGGSPAYISSSSVADIQLSFFSKFAIRFVTKNLTLNYGIGGTTGYVMFGLVDTRGTITPANQVNIYWESAGGSTNLYCTKAGTTSSIAVSGAFAGGSWADVAIYYDGTNVYARSGAYTGSPPSTLYGPLSTNIPTTTGLFWQVALIDGTTGNASQTLDLIEIAGELATPGGFRGEELVTSF